MLSNRSFVLMLTLGIMMFLYCSQVFASKPVYVLDNSIFFAANGAKATTFNNSYYAPKNSSFYLVNDDTVHKIYTIKFKNFSNSILNNVGNIVGAHMNTTSIKNNSKNVWNSIPGNTAAKDNEQCEMVLLNDINYDIKYDVMVKNITYHEASDFATGLLVVPFKCEVDHDITPSSTVGPYWGWQRNIGLLDINITFLGSLGLTAVQLNDVNTKTTNGKGDTEMGITGALGFVVDLAPQFQLAFILGKDHLGGADRSDWKYQDKWWYSAGIGFVFAKPTTNTVAPG